jgi:hypothetical protein
MLQSTLSHYRNSAKFGLYKLDDRIVAAPVCTLWG